ncbi:MAG: TetR/AcrR family transcriptional regulator [Bacteroidales bacterium]|nr:TetR/AcrR family transcriptional regulator [Bacteroidales bacterium]
MGNKKEQQSLDVKERILSVSRELFIKNGYNGTSVRDIAAASDTNVAHIKYYFNSKYKLFEFIFEEAFDVLLNRIEGILRKENSFFDLIKEWVYTYYDILVEFPMIPIFLLNEINQNPECLTCRLLKREPVELFNQLSDRIEEEVKKGTIVETSPLDLALNVLSLCVFPFMFGPLATLIAGKSKDEYYEVLQDHKEYVVDFVIKALKP